MERIEIGSEVRVRSDYFTERLVGHTGTVVAYHKHGADPDVLVQFEGMDVLHDGNTFSDRPLDGKCNKWWINPKELEVVGREDKCMTKKDLKSGMTVKLRNGNVCLVINDFITDEDSYMYLTDYDNNLVCTEGYKNLDIVEVYQFTNSFTELHAGNLPTLLDITKPNMQLLWKRQELPKLLSGERVLLSNLDKQYKWLARDKSGKLFAYLRKPSKEYNVWGTSYLKFTEMVFPNLCKFVKWEDEQPYNIEELLKGE